jgi:EmrB/QacA subfamily drug resistance transporter
MLKTLADSPKNVKRVALLVCTLSSILTPFLSAATNLALPAISAEFQIDSITLGWIQNSFLLSQAVLLLPFGRIADISGRKRIFAVGLLIFTLSSMAILICSSIALLLVIRILQGISGAMIVSTTISILMSVFPPHERGKVLGINTAGVYAGASFGPAAGGILIQYFGWRSIFLFDLPIAAATFLVTVLWLKGEWAEAKEARFDSMGALVYGIGLLTILLGTSFISAGSGTSAAVVMFFDPLLLMAIGTVILAAFILIELRSKSPLLDVRIFKNNKIFAVSNISAFINYSATVALLLLLSLYLQLVKGFSPQYSGLVLLAQPIVMTTLAPIGGWVSDRYSPRKVSSLGMAITALALFLLSSIERNTDVVLISSYLVIIGVGFAFFSSPNTNSLMGCVEKDCLSVASAMLPTMRQLGMIVSTIIAINILTIYIGTAVISSAPVSALMIGIHTTFIVFSALCSLGVIVSFLGG